MNPSFFWNAHASYSELSHYTLTKVPIGNSLFYEKEAKVPLIRESRLLTAFVKNPPHRSCVDSFIYCIFPSLLKDYVTNIYSIEVNSYVT